ncbi:MAG: sigma-54 dependent transcriptional regulator [Deltaproteobacteria bacterium]
MTMTWRARLDVDELVGRSQSLADVFERISAVCGFEGLATLITGATGTGKTAVARAIHRNSHRGGHFAMVNCAALPDALVESELFGAERGSHSTADARRVGKVEAATGGTLFLDEIADLSMTAQAKLLTVLQSRELYRLGGLEPIHVDFRLVCATNVDLHARVAEGRFRLDLLHRIDGFPIRMPGLDERREDVPLLAEHVLTNFARQCRRDVLRLAPSAAIALITRTWPGHVRELENVVRRGAVVAWMAGAQTLDVPHLYCDKPVQAPVSLRSAVTGFKRAVLLEVLGRTGWSTSAAASALGIARSHVYNLIRDYDIVLPSARHADAGCAR